MPCFCASRTFFSVLKTSRNLGISSSVNWTRSTFKKIISLKLIVVLPSRPCLFHEKTCIVDITCILVLSKPPVQISACRPAIQIYMFHGLTQLLQTNSAIVNRIRPWLLPATFFPLHYFPIFRHCIRWPSAGVIKLIVKKKYVCINECSSPVVFLIQILTWVTCSFYNTNREFIVVRILGEHHKTWYCFF
jgi:hypothetical protein